MKSLFFSLLILFSASLSNTASAQSSTKIQGKVISFEESFPLEGVSVSVKGTSNATGTQPDGSFNLEIKPGDSILVFRQEGYETQEVKINLLQKEYNVILKTNGGISGQKDKAASQRLIYPQT